MASERTVLKHVACEISERLKKCSMWNPKSIYQWNDEYSTHLASNMPQSPMCPWELPQQLPHQSLAKKETSEARDEPPTAWCSLKSCTWRPEKGLALWSVFSWSFFATKSTKNTEYFPPSAFSLSLSLSLSSPWSMYILYYMSKHIHLRSSPVSVQALPSAALAEKRPLTLLVARGSPLL